jgi:3-methylcrotonyl-CoA carboxylase alpha subunit
MVQAGSAVECRLTLNQDGSVTMAQGDHGATFTGLAVDGPHMSARIRPTNARVDALVRSASRGAERLVSVLTDGVAQEFVLPDPRAGSAALSNTGDAVVAPMTGMIVALAVAPGDTVEEGDKLGVIEAMKMEIGLLAPRAGTILEVRFAQGDSVEGGSVLITLEEEDER